MSAPLKRHQSFMVAEHDAAAFLPLLCSSLPSFIPAPNGPSCVCGGSAVTAQLRPPLLGRDRLLPPNRPSNAKKDPEQKTMLGLSSSSSVFAERNYLVLKSSGDCKLNGFFLPSTSLQLPLSMARCS